MLNCNKKGAIVLVRKVPSDEIGPFWALGRVGRTFLSAAFEVYKKAGRTTPHQGNVNRGGQECPPYTSRRRLARRTVGRAGRLLARSPGSARYREWWRSRSHYRSRC